MKFALLSAKNKLTNVYIKFVLKYTYSEIIVVVKWTVKNTTLSEQFQDPKEKS